MLGKNHPDSYHVYNLTQRTYDYSKFDDRVENFGWSHHHAPPLSLIFEAINAMTAWLSASPLHVAVVHCKDGQGRTGTIVSCLLLWLRAFKHPTLALKYFARRRCGQDGNGGVTLPSQKRFVDYFFRLLQEEKLEREPLALSKVILTAIPRMDSQGNCRPYLKIFCGERLEKELYTNKQGADSKDPTEGMIAISTECSLPSGHEPLLHNLSKGTFPFALYLSDHFVWPL